MTAYLVRRVLLMIPTLLFITVVSFVVMRLAPGDPVQLQTELNPRVSAEARERLIAYHGLDKPIHVAYFIWLRNVLTLDFGRSSAPDGRPVIEKIAERLPITLFINVISFVLVLGLAVPIGILSATRQGSWLDRLTTLYVFVGYAMPSFWLALLLMILFGVRLGWLPISGLHSLDAYRMGPFEYWLDFGKHLVLPVFIGVFGGLAGLSRYARSSMLEVIRQDYVRVARAKGLPETRVIYRHALRNALLPLLTIFGLSIPGFIGGSVIIESIFAIPGLGQLFYQSVLSRDYNLVMASLVIGAVLTMVGNLLADLSYAVANPQIRLGAKGGD
ncbi:MAG TPA: ABC transporter permease [Thermodesulfobacteriota bacterium]